MQASLMAQRSDFDVASHTAIVLGFDPGHQTPQEEPTPWNEPNMAPDVRAWWTERLTTNKQQNFMARQGLSLTRVARDEQMPADQMISMPTFPTGPAPGERQRDDPRARAASAKASPCGTPYGR